MSAEDEASYLRSLEIFSSGDLDVLGEVMADDIIEHDEMAPPGLPPGLEGVKAIFGMFRQAFPDLRMEADEVFSADGGRVVARMRMSGTHEGDFMGIPATGRMFNVAAIDIVRFEGGKAVEHWGITDQMALMQQLGVIPEQPSE